MTATRILEEVLQVDTFPKLFGPNIYIQYWLDSAWLYSVLSQTFILPLLILWKSLLDACGFITAWLYKTTLTSNAKMEDTEVIGYLVLNLWLFATGRRLDLFQRRLQARDKIPLKTTAEFGKLYSSIKLTRRGVNWNSLHS